MNKKIIIKGIENDKRLESRILEEKIQQAVRDGYRKIEVQGFGQHGIGGRLWQAGNEKIYLKITGQSGQRAGSLGFANTEIEIFSPASDDIGWLNAGAKIIVHGNATNGVCNGMAQGEVYIAGNIGSRGMTMTKSNPRFAPPELWVLGSAGDFFGEFMAGGIAVICGFESQTPDNVLGYRPLVGMVGGKVFFRGKHKGFSENDAKLIKIDDKEWEWFKLKLLKYLKKIKKDELFEKLSKREKWQLIVSKTPNEKSDKNIRNISVFRKEVWNKELGKGGLIGDLNTVETGVVPIIATGKLRINVPVWENEKYKAPCVANCPTGIPVQKRWSLIREGRIKEAINLALVHTPFPVTICGYLCPNLCMDACTKKNSPLAFAQKSINVKILGKASENAKLPIFQKKRKEKIAIIGGGVAGISSAWQLIQKGFNVNIFDKEKILGGKMMHHIPESRIPKKILKKEIERVSKTVPYKQKKFKKGDLEKIKKNYDYIIISTGAHTPRLLPIKGKEKALTALDFLEKAKKNEGFLKKKLNGKLIIIGAGNVGCDVATEAHRLGAKDITLIDFQKPLSFGEERNAAEKIGAKFKYPCFTEKIDEKGVWLTNGKLLSADTVIISIGDVPKLDFIPETIKTNNGFVLTNKEFRTSDKQIFAIGDITKPGLLTDAVGAGKIVANFIIKEKNEKGILDERETIDINRISLEYFNPKPDKTDDINICANECSSCGSCRDCGICVEVCPQGAISRKEISNEQNENFEYVVDKEKCIGCGFCKGACPCGIWNLIPNHEEID